MCGRGCYEVQVWSKFAKNSILVGQVDAYCLACECHLSSEESATLHINKPVHANNLHAVGYFEKYKDDYIRKVKSGYFCGMCNELLATAARAGLHVREPPHRDHRAALLLRRPSGGGGVLAHDTVLLAEDAWHGLVDDTCVLCNAEFEAKDIHKSEHAHILKLVENKVILGAHKSVYRKIDDNSYQCLTCNIIFSASSFNEHFDSTDHKTAHKLCEISDDNHVSYVMDKTDPSIDLKHIEDNSTSDKQNEVTKECAESTEVNIVDSQDVSSEPIAQHLDGKHHENMFKMNGECTEKNIDGEEPAQSEHEVNEDTKIVKDLETNEVEHVKENAQEMGSNNMDNRSQILQSVSTFQENDVNINFINDTAFCKKCTMNIDFDFNAINKHVDDHKKTSKKKEVKKVPFEHGVQANGDNKNLYTKPVFTTPNGASTSATSIEDVKALAKKNGMMYNGRELHCTSCGSVVPANIKNIEEHISGNKHKAKMPVVPVKQVPKKKITITKQPIENFIKDTKIFQGTDSYEFNREYVINESFCLPLLCLMFVGKSRNEFVCIACDMKIGSLLMFDKHVNSPRHTRIMEQCQVITSLESEFVREMRPGLYHCGFCNDVARDWEGMEAHLTTSVHKKCKTRSERRLQKHLRDERAQKAKPGMYNCSFCNYVANDWATLNEHFNTPDHMRTKFQKERCLEVLQNNILDPGMRQRMDSEMYESFKATEVNYNYSDSDSD